MNPVFFSFITQEELLLPLTPLLGGLTVTIHIGFKSAEQFKGYSLSDMTCLLHFQ